MSRYHNRPIPVQQFVIREAANVKVAVTGSKFKRIRVWIVWITAIANYQVSVATVHNYGVETQDATVAGATHGAFVDCATAFIEKAVDDLHLSDEALWVNHQVRLSAVVVDREDSRNTRSL